MISLRSKGLYRLIETKRNTKILHLDNKMYAWVETAHMGELLVVSRTPHKTDCVLSVGHYRLYDVLNEPHLSDHVHLELEVGSNHWQGYLLLSGLPNSRKIRGRIIPTHEVITNNSRFDHNKDLYVNLAAYK
jgi:hypothetical protein